MPADRFSVSCTVTVGSSAHEFKGASVRSLDASLSLYGCEGEVELLVLDDSAVGDAYEDAFLSDFASAELTTVSLELRAAHSDHSADATLPTLKTQGVVVERSMREQQFERELSAPTILVRVYRLRFVDRASALWTQHYPLSLYCDKTLTDLLDAERGTVTLAVDWTPANASRPQMLLPLAIERGVSFYDAFFWILSSNNGQCFYDHTAGTYAVKGARPDDGETAAMRAEWTGAIDVRVAVSARSQRRLVNVDATIGARRALEAPNAATGVFADTVMRTSVSQDIDDRVDVETGGGAGDPTTMRVEFAAFPDVAIAPGSVLSFATSARFAQGSIAASSDWRVFLLRVQLRSNARTPDEWYGESVAGYAFDASVDLEKTACVCARMPAFRAPEFPLMVEGIVQSNVGEDDQLTYQSVAEESTSIDQYRVKLTVFDGLEVKPFYQPELSSGAVYIPAYKSETVLVAMQWDRCRIARHLAWREGARPPAEGQGQRVYLGKNEKDNTKLTHSYESDNPVFELKRVHNNDTLFLKLEEGKMTLRVEQVQGEGGA